MIISDLSHLDIISENNAILGGAATSVTTEGTAYGDSTKVKAITKTNSIPLGNGGSLSLGFGYVKASAVDAKDASAKANVSGTAEGDINFVIGNNYSIDTGRRAQAGGFVFAYALDLPKG
ncbi:hypothetical protein [Scytonema sp. NUACC26]|uniref:hypothetical protein n=1 Tax=Scytonema sp. NUACC26 TaxID=3140176 RepID=UPI0034DB8337